MSSNAFILVVDDEEIERKMIVHILKSELGKDYEVEEASNGLEAIECVKKHLPQIVIMDIRMPLMNGLTALKEIFEIAPDISPVILTAHDEFEYAVQALKLGVEDYILKPVRGGKLLDAISGIEEKKNASIRKDENEWKRQFDFFTPYIEDSMISAIVMDSYTPEKMKNIIHWIFPGASKLYMVIVELEKMDYDTKKRFENIKEAFYEKDVRMIGSYLGRQIVMLVQCECGPDNIKQIVFNKLDNLGNIKISLVEKLEECPMVYRGMNFGEIPEDTEHISDSFFCDEKGIAIKIAVQELDEATAMMEELLIYQKNLSTV